MENDKPKQSNETKQIELAKRLNSSVMSVIGSEKMQGFERAFQIANAAQELQQLLTPEYMKPIMALQNNRLGFKTDAIYTEDVVKNCLIEAVLTGVQPFGNQFNIIAGNCYLTKEGFGYLLNQWRGLDYEIIPDLPRINADKTAAAIKMKVIWTLNGGPKETRELDIPVRMNARMGTDAVIGKATRKARAWLHNRISGIEITDGDVNDTDASGRITIPVEEVITLEQVKQLYEERSENLSALDRRDALRIIENQESKSYKKLYNLLTKSDAKQ